MTRRTNVFTRWHQHRWILVALLIASLCPFARADLKAPQSQDRQIAFTVAALVKGKHLSRHPLDNEISERCLKSFLKSLDPMKVYFYQSDVDEFMKHQDSLCSALQKGDITFAYTVFRTFLDRVDERVRTVDELLAHPLDFTVDEQMVTDRDMAQYPRDRAEAQDRWRKRVKFDMLVLEANKKDEADAKTSEQKETEKRKLEEKLKLEAPIAQTEKEKQEAKPEKGEGQDAVKKLARRYRSFAKRMHQVDSDELLEMYLNAFTTSFDPHTDYMSPSSQENFRIVVGVKLEGIGASLMSEDGYTIVKKVIPGGTADKDGRIKMEDKIVGVGQDDAGEIVDVVDMKLNDVVKLIRGKKGTTVRLEVLSGSWHTKIYKIVREEIELKDSEAKGEIFDAGRKSDGTPYHIGVIDLPSFYSDMEGNRAGLAGYKSTTRDVRAILDNFRQKNVDAVVLDLRNNGGGALNEALSLTELFDGDGPVVQVKDADGRVQQLDDGDTGVAWRGPLVVLISKFSASASEILAGAIQDYRRGLIVGDNSTHGKGTVQSLLDLNQQLFRLPDRYMPAMGALKITQQQFYRPNGDSTQKRGVEADIELPSLTTHLVGISESDLDYPVAFDHVNPAEHQRFDFVNPAVTSELRELSKQRVQSSERFQKVLRNVAHYKEMKAKKSVTLNEQKFLKEQAELNADKEEEKAIEKHSELNDGKIERDYYLDEVLAIVNDYLNMQHVAKVQRTAAGS